MMRERTRLLYVLITLDATLPSLTQTPEPMEVRRAEALFEELPVLNAAKSYILVALSGQVPPQFCEELEKRSITVRDGLVPGPLK